MARLVATSIALTAVGASPSTAEAKVKGDCRPTNWTIAVFASLQLCQTVLVDGGNAD
jgi:hypothetical protein